MVPVVWICGAPGVGKSVTAWELFRKRADLAYLDIDQVGMLYPDRESDGDGHRLQQHALAALLPNYAERTDRLLVSGVLDPALVADPSAPLPRAAAHYCLLTVDPDTLRRRVLERGWTAGDADEAVVEQEALAAAGFADEVVDTSGLAASEVADLVAAGLPGARATSTPEWADTDPGPSRIPSLFVTGPRAVGCSTVGFELARRSWAGDVRTGFADLGQLSFLRGPGTADDDPDLGLTNLATLSLVFAQHGAERFVANGHLGDRPAPEGSILVRLRADEASLRAHVRSRYGGNAARLTGDDLAAATPAHQEDVLRAAWQEQARLDVARAEELLVDVSDRGVDDVVNEIAAHLRWSLRP
jgi:broad-specificity NMP kinase